MDIPVGTYKISTFYPYEPSIDEMLNLLRDNPGHVYIRGDGSEVWDLSPEGRIRAFMAPEGVSFWTMIYPDIREYMDGLLSRLAEGNRG